jgi:hypothetical protein
MLLVPSTSLCQNGEKRIPDKRFLQLTLGNCQIKVCQVATVEMPH